MENFSLALWILLGLAIAYMITILIVKRKKSWTDDKFYGGIKPLNGFKIISDSYYDAEELTYTFTLENKSDVTQYTGLLVKKNINNNIEVTTNFNETGDYCDFHDYITSYHQYIKRIRVQASANFPFYTLFTSKIKHPSRSISTPMFIPLDIISPYQLQSTIVEHQCELYADGVTTDIFFNVNPNEKIAITLIYKDDLTKEINRKYPLDDIGEVSNVGSIVIENNSEEEKQITLFDYDKYLEEYSKDSSLVLSSLYDSSYKLLCNEIKLLYQLSINYIKVFSLNSKQVVRKIEFNNSDGYYSIDMRHYMSPYQQQTIVAEANFQDIKIGESEWLPTVTVLPHTKVAYLFKRKQRIESNEGN